MRFILISALLFPLLVSAQLSPKFIGGLDSIKDVGIAENHPKAYFAILYKNTTERIFKLINAHSVSRPGFLDTLSQNFYLLFADAVKHCYDSSGQCMSWQASLTTAPIQQGNALKKLALGINAHVNHDLIFAVVQTLESNGHTPGLDDDYKQLTKALEQQTLEIFTRLTDSMPNKTFLKRLVLMQARRKMVHELRHQRQAIWKNALQCLRHPERKAEILQKQVRYSEKLTDEILHPGYTARKCYKWLAYLDQMPMAGQVKLLDTDGGK